MTIILLLVGLAGLIFGGELFVDVGILITSCVMLLLWAYTGRKCRIDRWEGGLMLLAFAAYYYYLITNL